MLRNRLLMRTTALRLLMSAISAQTIFTIPLVTALPSTGRGMQSIATIQNFLHRPITIFSSFEQLQEKLETIISFLPHVQASDPTAALSKRQQLLSKLVSSAPYLDELVNNNRANAATLNSLITEINEPLRQHVIVSLARHGYTYEKFVEQADHLKHKLPSLYQLVEIITAVDTFLNEREAGSTNTESTAPLMPPVHENELIALQQETVLPQAIQPQFEEPLQIPLDEEATHHFETAPSNEEIAETITTLPVPLPNYSQQAPVAEPSGEESLQAPTDEDITLPLNPPPSNEEIAEAVTTLPVPLPNYSQQAPLEESVAAEPQPELADTTTPAAEEATIAQPHVPTSYNEIQAQLAEAHNVLTSYGVGSTEDAHDTTPQLAATETSTSAANSLSHIAHLIANAQQLIAETNYPAADKELARARAEIKKQANTLDRESKELLEKEVSGLLSVISAVKSHARALIEQPLNKVMKLLDKRQYQNLGSCIAEARENIIQKGSADIYHYLHAKVEKTLNKTLATLHDISDEKEAASVLDAAKSLLELYQEIVSEPTEMAYKLCAHYADQADRVACLLAH